MKKPRFINRELTWLEFNQRVLDEARDPETPLLERLKFLAITASNLDEFFMVRVGGLQLLAGQGRRKRDPAGLTPTQQLSAIRRRVLRMVADQAACYHEEIEPGLKREGLCRVTAPELSETQYRYLEQYFEEELFSVLSPMALTSDLPRLPSRTILLAVRLKAETPGGRARFAVLPSGRNTNRFITLPGQDHAHFILLEDVLTLFMDRFFPGEVVAESCPIRLTRNADISVREDMAYDLLSSMEQVLVARRESPCVRLEMASSASKPMAAFLKKFLHVEERNVYRVAAPAELSAFMQLSGLDGFDHLRYEEWPPAPSPNLDPRKPLFETLADKPALLYHPFEQFDPVIRLLDEAADDADVIAIKQILYRTSGDSPIIKALQRAARRGKSVTAIVELKARFDEARNIEWARALEHAGVQVIYGVKGLKTHAKICIVVRREPDGIRRYLHFGTGNYNERTATLYTDASYLICDPELGRDASSFFNAITGFSQPRHFGKLDASPLSLRERHLQLIRGEIERRKQGQPARILAKMNSLADPEIIDTLYEASRAGVHIGLNIRGICCLRPGVSGLSENIRVVSIVDRFLEHSRLFYYHQGGTGRVYLSSADWMPRNLDRRIELLVPVEDREARRRLIHILETCLADNVKGRELLADGGYRPLRPGKRKKPIRSQEVLYREAQEAYACAERSRKMVFEPHRPPEDEA